MIEQFFRWQQARVSLLSSPVGSHLDDLATTLVRQGFGRWKVRQRLHGAAHFSVFNTARGMSVEGLHEDLLPAFRTHLRTCRCPRPLRHGRHADVCAVAGAQALVEHLRQIGVVRSPARMPTAPDVPPVMRRFHTWMQQQRGLQDGTVRSAARHR